MKKIATTALASLGVLALAACGDTEDASTEAMPDTVEMPADEALEPVRSEPVEDSEAAGPPPAPVDPRDTAPDQATTEEAADAAAQVAADAEAAAAAAAASLDEEVEED
ncbi:MAG: hypothetical protein WA985_00070 [Erythrobacter sp.]